MKGLPMSDFWPRNKPVSIDILDSESMRLMSDARTTNRSRFSFLSPADCSGWDASVFPSGGTYCSASIYGYFWRATVVTRGTEG
ncbi:hypothetical protein GCM10010924_40610 [Rhizobium wenxiniae]|nr:hypothetical protein GCM10010924_40610 [Rhizobium wenxiniae]